MVLSHPSAASATAASSNATAAAAAAAVDTFQHRVGPTAHTVLCAVTAAGCVLQLTGSGAFYWQCLRKGGVYKEWMREDERATLPYHCVADAGNALWMIATCYDAEAMTAVGTVATHVFD
jgi:hypothetical protein